MIRVNQVLVILAFIAIGGCARAPGGGVTGTRLAVTLRFAGAVNDNYQYFFLIRSAADPPPGINGPIPVIQPPYLNGFATAFVSQSPSDPNYTAGFTDFVEYSRVQRQVTASGYTLYHLPLGIAGDPNRDIFIARGEPDLTQPPGGGSVLYFELAINRLKPDPGELDPNNGQPARYLQINVVATTTTPHSASAIDPTKFLDAFGDQHIGSGSFNTFITIDTQQIGRIYQSSPNQGDPAYEPNDDTYPAASDPGIEMVGWTVQIKG